MPIKTCHRQQGISMIESLVALLVMALGILGLAGVQTRILVDTRTANNRATAIGLIQDLNDRMVLYRTQARDGKYDLAWGTCPKTSPCAINTDASIEDRNQWLKLVQNALPSGDATIFRPASNTNQIGVAIAWSANESKDAPLTNNGPVETRNPLIVNDPNFSCPGNSICHVVYVQP